MLTDLWDLWSQAESVQMNSDTMRPLPKYTSIRIDLIAVSVNGTTFYRILDYNKIILR